MIVDPNTGLPIGLSSTAGALASGPDYQARTVGGAAGMAGLDAAGYEQGSLMRMMEHIPTATQTTSWNAMRGGRTILKGGYKAGGSMATDSLLTGGSFWHGTAGLGSNPRAYGRMADASMIDPMPGSGKYTPFQVLSKGGNWAMRKSITGGKYMPKIFKSGGAAMNWMENAGIVSSKVPMEGAEFFSGGFGGRMLAAGKIGRGGGDIAKAAEFIGKTNPKLASAAKAAGVLPMPSGTMAGFPISASPGGTSKEVSELMYGSARGPWAQYVGGYIGGAQGGPLSAGTKKSFQEGGQLAAKKGFQTANRHLGMAGVERVDGVLKIKDSRIGKKLGKKLGQKVGSKVAGKALVKAGVMGGTRATLAMVAGSQAWNPIGWVATAAMTAWMVYDLANMGIQGMVGAADTAKDAIKSAKGSISKPVMGMGYQDTTVAATSRQRGVQAIQNSRLNARSALGSEGAQLAAHFG